MDKRYNVFEAVEDGVAVFATNVTLNDAERVFDSLADDGAEVELVEYVDGDYRTIRRA